MPIRRDVLTFGGCATLAGLSAVSRVSAFQALPTRTTLLTRLFNFKEDVSPQAISDLIVRLRAFDKSAGIDSLLVGQNFIPTPFPSRFEWIYMAQLSGAPSGEAPAAHPEFSDFTEELSSHCRNSAESNLGSSFPAKFADAAGVKVRHTVMFNFRPDAPAEARERNVEAIRRMGKLPMVRRYFVERAMGDLSDPTQMEWQVIGDFGSVADYRAYSEAPIHLAIRQDFTAHTSRVAFLDVEP